MERNGSSELGRAGGGTSSCASNSSYSLSVGKRSSRSSNGAVEPSGAVTKAQNFPMIFNEGLNWSSQRNCPCSLISRNHHCPLASTPKSSEPKHTPVCRANSRIPFSTSGGVGTSSADTWPKPASCRQSSAFLVLLRAYE